MFPACWAPEQLTIGEGLTGYGYHDVAERVARRFLAVVVGEYKRTGKVWEKYNVVEGTTELLNVRYGKEAHAWLDRCFGGATRSTGVRPGRRRSLNL